MPCFGYLMHMSILAHVTLRWKSSLEFQLPHPWPHSEDIVWSHVVKLLHWVMIFQDVLQLSSTRSTSNSFLLRSSKWHFQWTPISRSSIKSASTLASCRNRRSGGRTVMCDDARLADTTWTALRCWTTETPALLAVHSIVWVGCRRWKVLC